MKAGDQSRPQGNGERTDQRDELEQAGHDTKEQCVGHPYQHESDRAKHADEETGQQRGAHVRDECVIDVLEQLGTASAKPPARKGQENVAAERRAVLQQKERHDGNQNEPGQIAQ